MSILPVLSIGSSIIQATSNILPLLQSDILTHLIIEIRRYALPPSYSLLEGFNLVKELYFHDHLVSD